MSKFFDHWRAKATGVVGGALLVVGASALEARADDAPEINPAAATSISHSEELRLLRQAEDQSSEHAMAAHNVGLVLHVGDDIPPQHLQTVIDHYENHFQAIMAKSDDPQVRAGTARMFTSPNPGASASLVSIKIGDGSPYEIDNASYGRPEDLDPALLGLQTAINAAEEIVSQIPNAKFVQAQNEIEREQTASLTVYDPG